MPTMAIGSSVPATRVAPRPASACRRALLQVRGQGGGRRIVEDERRGQPDLGGRRQPVAQFDGGQRVEPEVGEGPVGRDLRAVAVAEHERDLGPDQPEQVVGRRRLRDLAARRAHQTGEQRAGHSPGGVQQLRVEPGRDEQRPVADQGGVEQGQARGRRPSGRRRCGRCGPGPPRPGRRPCRGPTCPRPARRRAALGAAAGGQRVEGGVGGGVVALPGRAEHPGDRGEQHERAARRAAARRGAARP